MFELLLDVMDRLRNLRDTNAECAIALLPSKVRNFVTPIIESVRTPARIRPYPTGRLFWGGAVPGTSCQATIAPSLRDISQQASAKYSVLEEGGLLVISQDKNSSPTLEVVDKPPAPGHRTPNVKCRAPSGSALSRNPAASSMRSRTPQCYPEIRMCG